MTAVTGPVAILAARSPSGSLARDLGRLERQGVPILLVLLGAGSAEPPPEGAIVAPGLRRRAIIDLLRALARRPRRTWPAFARAAWASLSAEPAALAHCAQAPWIARTITDAGARVVLAESADAIVARLVSALAGIEVMALEHDAPAAGLDAGGARIDAGSELADLALGAAPACGASGDRIGVASVHRGAGVLTCELLLPGAPRRVVARRHADGEAARREHDALAALHAEGLAVPRPLGLDASRAIVVTDFAKGRPADQIIRRARRDPTRALHVAGAAWFWLEQLRQADGPRRPPEDFFPDAVLARLRRELRDDARRCVERGLPRRLVEGMAARAARELPDAVPQQACWTHGDFRPANVLVDAREGWDVARITVIGLQGIQPGLPLEDAASFLEHVALALPSLLSLSRLDRTREEIESVLLTGRGETAVIPQALRVAKALRLAARTPALDGPRWRRSATRLRILARLLEVRA